MPNYVTASGSNIILAQLTHLRDQGIFNKVVESPTRSWSSLSCFETTPSIQVSIQEDKIEYINKDILFLPKFILLRYLFINLICIPNFFISFSYVIN